jgi:menaquinol-cytochrome c reductase iron-sulfur subunit
MTNENIPSGCGQHGYDPERRRFLARLSTVLAAILAALIAVPVVGFIIGPLIRKEPDVWRAVGKVSDFGVNTTTLVKFADPSSVLWAGLLADTAAWLRRISDAEFVAFSINCAHLGCPVRWEASAQLFLCPCHGGVYYPDGSWAAGPPPRGLFRYPVRVRNAQVEILASAVPIE